MKQFILTSCTKLRPEPYCESLSVEPIKYSGNMHLTSGLLDSCWEMEALVWGCRSGLAAWLCVQTCVNLHKGVMFRHELGMCQQNLKEAHEQSLNSWTLVQKGGGNLGMWMSGTHTSQKYRIWGACCRKRFKCQDTFKYIYLGKERGKMIRTWELLTKLHSCISQCFPG